MATLGLQVCFQSGQPPGAVEEQAVGVFVQTLKIGRQVLHEQVDLAHHTEKSDFVLGFLCCPAAYQQQLKLAGFAGQLVEQGGNFDGLHGEVCCVGIWPVSGLLLHVVLAVDVELGQAPRGAPFFKHAQVVAQLGQ